MIQLSIIHFYEMEAHGHLQQDINIFSSNFLSNYLQKDNPHTVQINVHSNKVIISYHPQSSSNSSKDELNQSQIQFLNLQKDSFAWLKLTHNINI